jgi:hypothetical protein
MFHWVCTDCWGDPHEEKAIGGVLPKDCASCGATLEGRRAHPVQDEEFARIQEARQRRASKP